MRSCGEYLNTAIDVSVLPYRFGTHSGWLEACFDLGTAVVAPSCGFYAQQRPCVIYRHDEAGLEHAASLAGALRSAFAQGLGPRAIPSRRREERRALAARPSFDLCAVAAMRIAIIAAARFPVVEPFAGGLEAHVWGLADRLRTRGHEVTLFAGPGSDPRLGVQLLDLRRPRLSDAARADVSMTAPEWVDEHHAYLQLMLRLGRSAAQDFDVIHNHSLHYLPVAMAATVPVPIVCTLHTPPTPWLESAVQADEHCPVHFVAVSEHTARAWSHLLPHAPVIHNGVDVDRWSLGPGGGPPVWFGRIAPEKGTHLAIDAAVLAGSALRLAGPISDRPYFEAEIRPRLALDGHRVRGPSQPRGARALPGRCGRGTRDALLG